MHIGKRIKDIREGKGITQTFINKEMAKSTGWLANIEKGRRQINANELIQIADLMGVSMQEFFDIPTENKKHRCKPENHKTTRRKGDINP